MKYEVREILKPGKAIFQVVDTDTGDVVASYSDHFYQEHARTIALNCCGIRNGVKSWWTIYQADRTR